MTLRQLLRGLSTYVPGIDAVVSKLKGTGGTVSSRYCYSVWLRHLVMLEQSTGRTSFETIAELGPGDSLGIGLAGMLTGSNHYHAFDIIKFASVKQNLKIFDELVELFRNREPIPAFKHLEYLLRHGFRLKCDQTVTSTIQVQEGGTG